MAGKASGFLAKREEEGAAELMAGKTMGMRERMARWLLLGVEGMDSRKACTRRK